MAENEEINRKSNKNSLNKQIQKKLAKSVKGNAAKKSLYKVLMPYLLWAIAIIVILIVIIGIILFFITMPGMVMDKLKKLSLKIGKDISAFFGGDTTKQVDKERIYDVLNYLEEMGYDLAGYGFLTNKIDDKWVERDDNDEITNAKSDFIYTYLVSDNYTYTIANFNQINGAANNGHRILGGIISLYQKWGNLLTGGQLGRFWGRGMLSIYHELSLGVPGAYYGESLGWSSVKIDIDEKKNEKKLLIRRGYGSNTVEYNLDGWTGRYGMPIDFLLAVHIATMMPDLSYDMVETFDTQIMILLHPTGSYFEGNAEYAPYISKVKNHWYRDIYFVQADEEFVNYDYDYEAINKERWTLYKTYSESENPKLAGEYKLYLVDQAGEYIKDASKVKTNKAMTDSDGYYYYTGTREEAEEENIDTAKKAETLKYSSDSDFEDISWNKYAGRWTAYKLNGNLLTQTGEGLRTETNPEIKKMFLSNRYFKYDGSEETANIILELRKKLSNSDDDLYYGVVKGINTEGEFVDHTKTKVKIDDKEYKIEDFSGEVSLNQDSLNAFSMLENEHTLDSDYIYRDFKELIVELGYFEKEELTDEIPKLLEFPVPDIGSYQYPKRELDKVENEFGTLMHSKWEYLALKKQFKPNTEMFDERGGDTIIEEPELSGETAMISNNAPNNVSNLVGAIKNNEENDFSEGISINTIENDELSNLNNVVGSSGSKISKDFDDVGWESKSIVEEYAPKMNINTVSNYYKQNDDESYTRFMESLGGVFAEYGGKEKFGTGDSVSLKGAQEYVYSCIWIMGFDYCAVGGDNSPDYDYSRCSAWRRTNDQYCAYAPLGRDPGYFHHTDPYHCGGGRLIDDAMEKYKFVTCCNYTVDKVMYEAGLFGGEDQPTSSSAVGTLIDKFDAKPVFEIKDLHFGDIIECYETNGGNSTNRALWSGWYHVMYVGEEYDDKIVVYTTGHDLTNTGNWRREISKDAPRSAMPAKEGWVGLHIWDLDYGAGKQYEGYKGNEAVVSPVTGILLEYGTYDDSQEYRLNTDLKYGTDRLTNEEKIELDNQFGYGIDQYDKVGYAKILVLDDEYYKILESRLLSKTRWNESFLKPSGKFSEVDSLDSKKIKEWTDVEKTLYGYKEFAEDYKKGGISGYVVYIDGFKPETVDKTFDMSKIKEEIPADGEKIDFQKVKVDIFDGSGKITDKKQLLESKYEQDERYKMPSKKASDKLNTEATLKKRAISSLYLPGIPENTLKLDDMIVIKEGTVLGRTITDRELITKIRNQDESLINDTFRPSFADNISENVQDQVMGNYLRIMMRDKDGTLVENVEDYMKLDDGTKKKKFLEEQPYKQDPDGNDLYRVAALIHHEYCASAIASIDTTKVRDVNGNWVKASSLEGCEDDTTANDDINKVVGYVLINCTLISDYDYIKDYMYGNTCAYGECTVRYATASAETTDRYCAQCLRNAEWVLTYDCTSVSSSDGHVMTRDCVTQSSYDTNCSSAWYVPNTLVYWWLVDTNGDNSVRDHCHKGSGLYDAFFLRDTSKTDQCLTVKPDTDDDGVDYSDSNIVHH